ncbi:MAG: tetratricopeptide repeat protein, partial [Candidatus Rhabdochlamydia sp.]
MNPTSNFPSSCSYPRIVSSSIKTVEAGMKTINNLLERDILCSHDIRDLEETYHVLNTLEQKFGTILQQNSQTILSQITQRVQAIHQDLSGKEIINAYHLRKFEVSSIHEPFNPSFPLTLTIQKTKEIATFLPFCGGRNDFESDVKALLGKEIAEEVKVIIQDKKDQIYQREKLYKQQEINKRIKELHQLREKDALLYPLYMEEILNGGYFHLYDHLIKMKKLPTQAEREAEEKNLSFSTFSHIILEFKEAALAQAEKRIPQGSNTLFLLGDTGSGKSTTLCYLRKDSLILQDDNYQSLVPGEDLIGNNGQVSCTLFPNIADCQDLIIVDFPGFNDTHGKVIALAIELVLRALVKKYSPKILVLSSITDTESRFNHALRLGDRLKRILGTLDHCTLGLTKYSKDPDFINIKNIEARQRQECEKLALPSREEYQLEGTIEALLSLVDEMPHIQNKIDQKREELLKLQQKRSLVFQGLLPNTEEKTRHLQNLHEKEEIFKGKMGIKKMIPLADLTDQKKLEELLDTFKLSQNISSLPKYHHLDPVDKELLNTLFKDKPLSLLTPQKDYRFSSLNFDFSKGALNRSKLSDHIKMFEKSILETSLINILLLKSHPEIGQFFHLEEMDPAIVKNYDKDVIEKCIHDYIYGVLSDLIVLQKTIEMFEKDFSKEQKKILDDEFLSLKKYILILSIGLPEQADRAKVDQAWSTFQKEHEFRVKNRKNDLKISGFMTGVLLMALGIPYVIFRVFKENAIGQTTKKLREEITGELCERIRDITQAIQHLKEIERTVKDKDRFDEVFVKNPLLLDSISSLYISLSQQIDQVKHIYGKAEWERRVKFLKGDIQNKFLSQKEPILYAIMSQEFSWKELPPYFNEHTFLALIHSFSTSQGNYQDSIKQLVPGWEAASPWNLNLSNPGDFFYAPGIKKQDHEKLKTEGRRLLEQYQKTPVTKLLLIDAIRELREIPSSINEYKVQYGAKTRALLNFSLSNDQEKILDAVQNNAWILEYGKEWLLKDEAFILAAIEKNENALKFASDDLKNDRDFVLAAVKQDIRTFEFASESLKNNHDVILTILKEDWQILKYMSKSLKNNHHFIFNALNQLHHSLGNLHPVIGYYKENLKHALEQNNRLEEERFYGNLGIAYRVLKDYQNAIKCYKKMLEIALGCQSKESERIAYISLGNAYDELKDYSEAIKYHESALKIALELKDKLSKNISYNKLDNIYYEFGDDRGTIIYDKKEPETTLELSPQIGQGPTEALAYGNLGNGYYELGDYREAIAYHEKALKIALELKDRVAERAAYSNLGNSYEGLGNYREAITYHEKDLKIALELKDRVGEGRAYGNLGASYDGLGN